MSKSADEYHSRSEFHFTDWAPSAFLVFVFFLGGASRSDVASLPLLRGGSVIFAFWAATHMRREDWRRIRAPFLLLTLLTLLSVVQIVPLPPGIWHALPGRDTIAALDQLLGQPDLWRPLSLTPSLTWNSALAMTVPFAALFLAAAAPTTSYQRIAFAIVAIAGASALLGLIQVLSGQGSPAYLYRITNTDSMVGLFANRNHHAVFLACAIPIAAALLRDEFMRKRQRKSLRAALAFAIPLLTLMTVLIGSRAGFATGVVGFAVGYAIIVPACRTKFWAPHGAAMASPPSIAKKLLLYSPPILLACLLAAGLWLSNRATAISRLAERDVADDMRVQAWPTVQTMLETHWVVGTGQGSFADAFKMFEPDSLLQPSYFNHVHNDWIELVITGGVPFALITLALLVWVGRKFVTAGFQNLVKGHRGDRRLPALVMLAILAAASFVDYPLRVPAMQAMAIMLLLISCAPATGRSQRD